MLLTAVENAQSLFNLKYQETVDLEQKNFNHTKFKRHLSTVNGN